MTTARAAAWLLTAIIAGPIATITFGAAAVCFQIAAGNLKKSLHALAWT